MARGFSLIELLITITIIAIIAVIAMPAYTEYVVSARAAELVTSAHPAQLAVGSYVVDNNTITGFTYASDAEDFTSSPTTVVSSITVTNGVIVVTGNSSVLESNTIVLTFTPTVSNNKTSWICASSSTFHHLLPKVCQN